MNQIQPDWLTKTEREAGEEVRDQYDLSPPQIKQFDQELPNIVEYYKEKFIW